MTSKKRPIDEFADDVLFHLQASLTHNQGMYDIMCKRTDYNFTLHKHEQLGSIRVLKQQIENIKKLAEGYKLKLER